MNNDFRYALGRISISKSGFFLLVLLILAIAALIDFLTLGLARRTLMFYDIDSGVVIVENRLLPVSRGDILASYGNRKSSPRELDITRYVEEALLGPVSSNSMPLFPREARLSSLLYRNGVVYLDLSEEAVLPPPEGGEVFLNMKTLYAGIRRNFPFIREVRFFIAGKAAYAEAAAEFRQFAEALNLNGFWESPQKNVVKKRNSDI
jgi:thiamine pyrophosphate-dependent acetolactate synthase large subunit-like protein